MVEGQKDRATTIDTKSRTSEYDIIEVEEARTLEEKEKKERERIEKEEQEGKEDRKHTSSSNGKVGLGIVKTITRIR